MKKRLALIATSVALVTMIVAGGTLAWFSQSFNEIDNKIQTSGTGVDGTITDVFPADQVALPGGTINKEVGITSTGDAGAYGRVHVKMYWSENGTTDPLAGFEVSNEWLKTPDSLVWNTPSTVTGTNETTYTYTIKGVMTKDKYYKLFDTVNLPKTLGNAYKNKTLHVVISGDLVQADNNDETTAWVDFVADTTTKK